MWIFENLNLCSYFSSNVHGTMYVTSVSWLLLHCIWTQLYLPVYTSNSGTYTEGYELRIVIFYFISLKYLRICLHLSGFLKGRGRADVPLFKTIKTNTGTQPKNELQQWALVWQLLLWCLLRNCEKTAAKPPLPPKTAICRRIFFAISRWIT